MSNRYVVVLAAGQGTRMKSKLYKVLHPVCGKPMVQHVIENVQGIQAEQVITVVGFGAEKVQEVLSESSQFVIQKEQLGTAHAVMQAKELLKDRDGTTLVICGDTPLIKRETLEAMVSQHEKEESHATVLTAKAEEPTGYGRIIRNDKGQLERIVEQKDATEEEKQVKEINAGTYCFDNRSLFSALDKVTNDNAQGEYYLPDVLEIMKKEGKIVSAFMTDDFSETLGVNDRVALSKAEKIMRKRINETHMKNGVTIIDPDQTYIDCGVEIGPDTIIYPGTVIKGSTVIQSDCVIGPNTEIVDSFIGEKTTVRQSVVTESKVGRNVQVGPYAHIRPKSDIDDEVRIGNFVEIKKTTFGKGSKASHLSYIGDAEVGKNVNIGCGTITVNYDGTNKYKTVIEDEAFIGCNSNLIAPVTVGKDSYIAAGSTITNDVPKQALSIARARQVNKENYSQKFKKKK
ncbi:bifunctional UDP-N-acetylglucosamine diphosphorylase/glucosamine-1-phosphate N-acetyltransferase GlmU [Fervidibacillus halotolerans]|uniref:Bifunctional protein GlmU n=1 Tax=Fervidibacillus halotolerans TaxID=2980027 RepID=A0A9E8LZ25_9BACI|nr:bifunctional UDP-N-acetylglucosamine diphosphorylase/glucosamine-1-phosphate N-acetyltransferase GlmU [Fervidibacillus halotolerans]WAA12342.1 bifunctional UDP-N-acetylglucosamine diphosphorylase/glucosamine-1-phosphate N-acetyltransferase GlmU [Fervidibacillus halotolerans]